jgi:hypothetical protein
MSVKIVSRDQASLRLPKSLTPINKPVEYVFIHHTASEDTENPLKDWSGIQGFHMNTKGWQDIAYTWGAGVDRRNGANQPVALEGRQINGKAAVGAHTLNWNSKSIAICAIGNFETDAATDQLIEAIKGALAEAKRRGQCVSNPVIWSHSEVVRTACAGHNLKVRIPELYGEAPATEVPVLPAPAIPTNRPYPGFPLPKGHWFGPESSNPKNHSGFWAEDRPHIANLKAELERRGWRIAVTGRFTQADAEIVKKFQREKGLKDDGLPGEITHRAIWEAPIT